MQDYGVYILASYAVTAIVLCWMLCMALRDLHNSEIRLKRLQSRLEPDREKAINIAG